MKLFVDTWGWLTLRDRRERGHPAVTDFYQDFRRRNGSVYPSDYLLDETVTLLFRRLPFSAALDSIEGIQEAVTEGYLNLSGSPRSVLKELWSCDAGFKINLESPSRI